MRFDILVLVYYSLTWGARRIPLPFSDEIEKQLIVDTFSELFGEADEYVVIRGFDPNEDRKDWPPELRHLGDLYLKHVSPA